MLLLFYMLFFLAAGSNASPCKPKSPPPAPPPGAPPAPPPGAPPAPPPAAPPDAPPPAAPPAAPPAPGSIPATDASQHVAGGQVNVLSLPNSPPAPPPSGGGSCPPGFLNAVFNTGAPKGAGWPTTSWGSLNSNGVNDWIGFSVTTLDKKETYSNCPVTPELNSHQIPLVMDPRDVDLAMELLKGPSPPAHLGLFNEPDFSFGGWTPLTDPIPAARNLSKLFEMPHPQTTFLSPGLMDAESEWLPTFEQNCNGCFAQIPIISMHVYNPTVEGMMGHITNVHNRWPDKKIWITELSPAAPECSMDANAIGNFINELFPKIIALGYVEKIFWNSGEHNSPAINGAPEPCNPSLLDAGGNPTPVLTALKNACGGGGTATS